MKLLRFTDLIYGGGRFGFGLRRVGRLAATRTFILRPAGGRRYHPHPDRGPISRGQPRRIVPIQVNKINTRAQNHGWSVNTGQLQVGEHEGLFKIREK